MQHDVLGQGCCSARSSPAGRVVTFNARHTCGAPASSLIMPELCVCWTHPGDDSASHGHRGRRAPRSGGGREGAQRAGAQALSCGRLTVECSSMDLLEDCVSSCSLTTSVARWSSTLVPLALSAAAASASLARTCALTHALTAKSRSPKALNVSSIPASRAPAGHRKAAPITLPGTHSNHTSVCTSGSYCNNLRSSRQFKVPFECTFCNPVNRCEFHQKSAAFSSSSKHGALSAVRFRNRERFKVSARDTYHRRGVFTRQTSWLLLSLSLPLSLPLTA